MKNVKVHFFAAFRDAAGCGSESVATDAASVADLFTELTGRHSGLHHEPAALVAINDEMASWDDGFEEGDEVLFFPPVAGG